MKKKKYSFTLLEVVIAVALLGVMLSALFSCFQQTIKKNIVAREVKQRVLQTELLDQRLKNIFSRLDTGRGAAIWLDEHSGAKNQALFVAFAQQTDRDPLFLGPLQGVVYADGKGHLVVETEGKKESKRSEVLMEQIAALRFELFDAEQGKWSTQWPKKKAKTPAMIKLTLERRAKETTSLVYFLSAPGEPITFQEVM